MKIHIVTVGKPKLPYAQAGFAEYINRLKRLHDVRVTHIPDKHNDAEHILQASEGAFSVALVIDGPQQSSEELAVFLKKRELEAREVCFMIGGPDGLPKEVIEQSDAQIGLSRLTFPHDLAMVVLAETLYRSSTINANHPYHH